MAPVQLPNTESSNPTKAGTFRMPSESFVKRAHVKSIQQYREMYDKSIKDPESFWAEIAKELHMQQQWTLGKFMDHNFDSSKGELFVKLMEGSKTNITYNCIDRWTLDKDGPEYEGVKKSKRAYKYRYYWEGNYWDEPTHDYAELSWDTLEIVVNKCANIMKSKGVTKGECVVLYMPTVFQLTVAVLGLAKIGAVSVIIPAGMNAEGLAQRVIDCNSKLIITVDGFWRGTDLIKTKEIVDASVKLCAEQDHNVALTIVVSHLSPHPGTPAPEPHDQLIARRPCYFLNMPFDEQRDEWWSKDYATAESTCEPEWMDAQEPLFIIYTQGGGGPPKRVVHTVGGFQLFAYAAFRHVMDYQPTDDRLSKRINDETAIDEKIFWSTHDLATVQGLTFGLFGPLLHGACTLQFEGVPTHPDPGRYWEIINTYKVDKVFMTPSDARTVMAYDQWGYCSSWDKSSLTLIAVSGEPLSGQAHEWLYRQVGGGRCPVVDTYTFAEAGGSILTSFPGATAMKPGSSGLPYLGIEAILLDKSGKELTGEATGYLCVKKPWPGIALSVCIDTYDYFQRFPGYFFTGDMARRDKDGYYYVLAHEADLIPTEGGTTKSPYEIEATINEQESIFDSAVVTAVSPKSSAPTTVAFVTHDWEFDVDKAFTSQLTQQLAAQFSGVRLDRVLSVAQIPRLKDGRVARRVLRSVISGAAQLSARDDLAVLNPESVGVVQGLVDSRQFL